MRDETCPPRRHARLAWLCLALAATVSCRSPFTGGPTIVLEPKMGSGTPSGVIDCKANPCWSFAEALGTPVAMEPDGSIFRTLDQGASGCWLRADLLGRIEAVAIVDAAGNGVPLTDLRFEATPGDTIAARVTTDAGGTPRLTWTADQDGYHACSFGAFRGRAVHDPQQRNKLADELVLFMGLLTATDGEKPIDLQDKQVEFKLRPRGD